MTQTTMGFDSGEPNHERLREHSADFTPRPVVIQLFDWLASSKGLQSGFSPSQDTMLDPAAGSGVFGQAARLAKHGRQFTTHGMEIREEEREHVAKHYDHWTIGDALVSPCPGPWGLIATNPPFHLWKEYVLAYRDLVAPGGMLCLLGLCSWGQRSRAGAELFADDRYRPQVQKRITGTIGFRGPGTNPSTGKKWGADTRDYCWWIWNSPTHPRVGLPSWDSSNLPLLDAADRRWLVRPGTV